MFLLAGPATNMATLGLVNRELGGRVLAAYLVGIAFTSMVFGLLTDYLVAVWQLDIQGAANNGHDMVPESVTYATAAFLLLLTLRFLWQKRVAARDGGHGHHHAEHGHSH